MKISSASVRSLCTAMLFVIVGALAGCSSAPRREAQWIDPSLGLQSRLMQGQKVLIACDAYDPAIRQICQDRLFRELQAKGASPLLVPPGTTLLNDRELDGQLVASAAALGARTIFVMSLAPATTSAGSGLSLGIGAFSFGGGGGGGIGLSAPIGGGRGNTGFAANGRVTDVRSSRLVWTASLVAAPSADLDAQFAALSRAMLDAAQGAGLF